MNFKIRKGVKADAAACHGLIKELAVFENAPDAVTNSLEQFTEDGFGAEPIYKLFVAELEDGNVVGMALFVTSYSTWKGKMLFLDDLVVSEAYRGNGIGQALIDALFDHARNNAFNIIKWHVLNWNEPAIKFYKKLGMTFDDEWIDCKFYL